MKYKILITYKLNQSILEKIQSELNEHAEIFYLPNFKNNEKILSEAEILYGHISRDDFTKARNLKWIHIAYAGADFILFPELIESNVILTCSKGIHQHHMTEFLFGIILTFTRKLREIVNFQKEKKWHHRIFHEFEPLYGKTIGILGLGNIGREIAKVAKAFGMKVIGMKRTPGEVENVDIVVTRDEIEILLKNSDFIVLALPLTKETYHMIGEKEFDMMEKKPYIFNIGRGAVIDESALIKALKEGKIRGAGLDVFEVEPLPENSPLWEFQNVIISPHVSGAFPNYFEEPTKIFIENFKRYTKGELLLNIVDKESGY